MSSPPYLPSLSPSLCATRRLQPTNNPPPPLSIASFAVKVRLQSSPPDLYRNPWQCAKLLVKTEGFSALYRGLTAPLVGSALETGVNYGVYWQTFKILTAGDKKHIPKIAAVPLAGATAGCFLSLVLSPFELVKCRLQVGKTNPAYASYTGPTQCLKAVVQDEGFRGLFRGLDGTLAREVPGNAIYFSAYTMFRHYGRKAFPEWHLDKEETRPLSQRLKNAASAVVCGGSSGMVMWLVVLPLDTAKTRTQCARPGDEKDGGVGRQLRMLWKEGRLKALYSGLLPTIVRAFPANAAQWLVWELCIDYWDRVT